MLIAALADAHKKALVTTGVLARHTAHFGFEPNAQQIETAHKFGGLHDRQTIRSIPKQAAAMDLRLFREKGKIPAAQEVADKINLASWGKVGTSTWTLPLPEGLDRVDDTRMAAIRTLIWCDYADVLGRAPDEAGLNHWRRKLRVLLNGLRADFRAGVTNATDRARMKALGGDE